MICLRDILNVLYSGHCYVKSVGGGHDMFLWSTRCSRQRYSAIGLMAGVGPQLSSDTNGSLQVEAEMQTMGLCFTFYPSVRNLTVLSRSPGLFT